MLVHEGANRTTEHDLVLATALAFVAGGTNSAGYFAYGYFSANMTGNVSMISDNISIWQLHLVAAFSTIVVMFVFGAFMASFCIEVGRRKRLGNIYALTLLFEAIFLMMIGLYSTGAADVSKGLVLAGLLAFTMGIQNAASTWISDSRVRTTHISGIATDIGVGFALLLQANDASDVTKTRGRLTLHIATILSFLSGGIAGVLGFKLAGGIVFLAFSLVLLAMCGRYLRRPQLS